MPEKVLKKFEVKYVQILDENGNCDEKIIPKELNSVKIKEIYELMVLSRLFDEKMFSLQRQGRLGTFAQSKGQEAADIGSVMALEKQDWMFPYFRNWPAYIALGYPMEMLLQFNVGDERGMKVPNGVNCFMICVPVATQIPHAVGFAWGAKMKRDNIVVLCYLGDGATSEGDFNEGMNFAGVFKVPIVFVCENNQYAISVPVSRQTGAETLAQKAIAYGIEGVRVDGNDVFAMYKVTKEAVDKARKGQPVFIEAFTYRLADHTTSDDARRYRGEEEVKEWMKKDPIDRLRKYMEKKKMWSAKDEEKLRVEMKELVEEAVKKAEEMPAADPEDVFRFMYSEPSDELREQMEYLRELLGEKKK